MPYMPIKCPRCGAPMKLWQQAEFNWLCVLCHCQTLNEPAELTDVATYLSYMDQEFGLTDHVPNIMLGLLHVPELEAARFGNYDVPEPPEEATSEYLADVKQAAADPPPLEVEQESSLIN